MKPGGSGMSETQQGQDGQVVLIDKPLQWTSFDVVKKVRSATGIKKVGHAGTLDPLATGLLIVCTGKMTKQISRFQDDEKEYTGVMEIGRTTPSVDLETEFDSRQDYSAITAGHVTEAVKKFQGWVEQTPPIYSAVKINGERSYNLARKGEIPEIKTRQVHLILFEATAIDLPEIAFRLVCSKGTYVRSLVRDFGIELGAGAYLKELRRVRIGEFHVSQAIEASQINLSLNEYLSRH